MSTAKPMTTADRQTRYEKQNGREQLTPRQQRQIRKTAVRASLAIAGVLTPRSDALLSVIRDLTRELEP